MKKDLDYYKKNAEEDYIKTPLSVLRYITELTETKREIWTITTDDIDSIKRLAMGGNLLTLKLTFSILKWRFLYVAKYYPYL